MEKITYKKPILDSVFLILMVGLILTLFWFYGYFNPTRLLAVDAIGAGLFVVVSVLVLVTGVRTIEYDGATLTIVYGFGYTRKYSVQEIEKIELQTRPHYLVILVYLKNGQKFSRGIGGKKAVEFGHKLKARYPEIIFA